jgi:methylene-tetrahydrofolate reductase-like protein
MLKSQAQMPEARRAPGSEWLKNHPKLLEFAYLLAKQLIARIYPLLRRAGPRATERLLLGSEGLIKGYAFNCQMCGQCILHSTGMTCPMNCPKNLRNGPCGGVRPDGHCEVIPEMPCVWVQAWERSAAMPHYGRQIMLIQPPLNRTLQGTSAWINLIEKRDIQAPKGWDASVGTFEGSNVRSFPHVHGEHIA